MGSLLSTMTGGVTGPLLRAGLFPAAIFTTLLLLLVVPLAPDALRFFERLVPVSPEWESAALLLVTLVAAVLLYALSTPVVRLYQGYPWQNGLLGRLLVWRNRKKLRRLRTTLAGMTRLRSQLDKGSSARAAIVSQISILKRAAREDYPDREDLVLPTRLGNTIRSAERYSSVEYRMDAIVLWPHLQSTLKDGYDKRLEEAGHNLSFLLNTAFSLLVLAGILVGIAVRSPAASLTNTLAPAALLVVTSLVLYRGAIGAAKSWGNLVRGAFDLYRGPLLEKLGYGTLPESRTEERKLWSDITQQKLYGDKEQYPEEDYPAPQKQTKTITRPRLPRPMPDPPSTPPLEVARGVRRTGDPTELEVVVSIRNAGEGRIDGPITVKGLVLDGYAHLWGSGAAAGRTLRVLGEDPPTFHVDGGLDAGSSVELTYRLLDVRPFAASASAAATREPRIPDSAPESEGDRDDD